MAAETRLDLPELEQAEIVSISFEGLRPGVQDL